MTRYFNPISCRGLQDAFERVRLVGLREIFEVLTGLELTSNDFKIFKSKKSCLYNFLKSSRVKT